MPLKAPVKKADYPVPRGMVRLAAQVIGQSTESVGGKALLIHHKVADADSLGLEGATRKLCLAVVHLLDGAALVREWSSVRRKRYAREIKGIKSSGNLLDLNAASAMRKASSKIAKTCPELAASIAEVAKECVANAEKVRGSDEKFKSVPVAPPEKDAIEIALKFVNRLKAKSTDKGSAEVLARAAAVLEEYRLQKVQKPNSSSPGDPRGVTA